MKITYDIAYRVWYIKAFAQWVVHPPDGFYERGTFTFLTNTHSLYFKTQEAAWKIAKRNARKYRSIAILYYMHRSETRILVDYRNDKHEEVQVTKRPQHLYP